MLYGPSISQSDCRKAGPYQLSLINRLTDYPSRDHIKWEAMNGHVILAVSILCEEFSNLKRIEKKIEESSVKPIIGEGI